jgi:hypothetical protein
MDAHFCGDEEYYFQLSWSALQIDVEEKREVDDNASAAREYYHVVPDSC